MSALASALAGQARHPVSVLPWRVITGAETREDVNLDVCPIHKAPCPLEEFIDVKV